jgi:hypothetical protein
MKKSKQLRQELTDLNACKDAMVWLGKRNETKMLADCHRGDWLLWYFFKMRNTPGYPDIKTITLVKVKCARLAQRLMKDQRSINALDVAERWANNQATDQERAAAYAAAAYAAYAAAAAAAAAAAYTADAAATAAYATAAYATAADAAAAYATAADDRTKILKQCANICREYLFIPK